MDSAIFADVGMFIILPAEKCTNESPAIKSESRFIAGLSTLHQPCFFRVINHNTPGCKKSMPYRCPRYLLWRHSRTTPLWLQSQTNHAIFVNFSSGFCSSPHDFLRSLHSPLHQCIMSVAYSRRLPDHETNFRLVDALKTVSRSYESYES